MKQIQVNNLELYIDGEREDTLLDSVMYYNDAKLGNMCELANEGGCITDYGIYFGTSDSHDPIFCPHHYFMGGGYEIKATNTPLCNCGINAGFHYKQSNCK